MPRGKRLDLLRYFVEYLSQVTLHVLHYHEKVLELELRVATLLIILADNDVVELGSEFVSLHLG